MEKKYAVQIEYSIPLDNPASIINANSLGYVILAWVEGTDDMFHVVKEIEVSFASEEQIDEYVLALEGAVYKIFSVPSDMVNEKTVQVYDRDHDTRFTH